MSKADIDKILAQEKALVFQRFGEAEAFELGCRLRDLGLARDLPIAIDIRLWDRPLFFVALSGATAGNAEWARRKFNAVRHYQKSSYRMGLEQQARVFPADHGLDPKDYATAGGSFPITVKGVGAIGAVTISGLPQREDHNLVVAALAAQLGLDGAKFALEPEG